MEKILKIEELNDAQGYEGYKVITDKQSIEIGISDTQICCESFGHFHSPDDVKDFVGADLLSISRVDTALQKHECIEYNDEGYNDEGGAMFINLETSSGTLQLAVYNSHNGYYGHEVYVKSEQLTIKDECI